LNPDDWVQSTSYSSCLPHFFLSSSFSMHTLNQCFVNTYYTQECQCACKLCSGHWGGLGSGGAEVCGEEAK
jgi:hypothetical protein